MCSENISKQKNDFTAHEMNSVLEQFETLRAENEALKDDMKDIRRANLSMLENYNEKDAQIRVLVDGLGSITEQCLEPNTNAYNYAKQALSAIPAETLKLYRLSEVLNKSSVEYHDAFHSKTQHSLSLTQEAKLAYVNDFRKAVNDFEAHRKGLKDGQVYTSYLEAHKERKR